MEKDTTKALKTAAFSLVFMFVMVVVVFYFHSKGDWTFMGFLKYTMSMAAFVNIMFSLLAIFVNAAIKEIPDSSKLHKQVLVFIMIGFIWLNLCSFNVLMLHRATMAYILWGISLIWTGVVLYRVLRRKRVDEEHKIDTL